MRRSGKTTKLIDKAVDHFFTNGIITIPKKRGVDNSFVDPDSTENNHAQWDFIERFTKRMHSEHDSQFTVTEDNFNVVFKRV